nr:MAG TPA: hypothetical protein [Caudoviricetes sp.]
MEWINETPKEPKMCRLSAAVLACLLCVMAGIMALRWEIRTEHPHLVRPATVHG